jgi:glycosyltransferase involved in cell wall biosynthesis
VTARTGPLVSVIVPAFNAEQTLRKTLISAAASTYRNIEIVIVDDGSTDATAEIADSFARSDDRIQLKQRTNGGLSAALNSGFALARGSYIARLDADDLWHPSKLERQIEFALRHPEIGFIYAFARYIDTNDRVVRDGPPQAFPHWALCRGMYESLVGGGSSALMKRSAVEEAGGCDESFKSWEDLLLQLAISDRYPIGFVPEYLVGYRLRTNSLSNDIDNMLRGWRAVRTRLASQFEDVPSFVHAWAHGTRCAMFAEGYAWRGRYRRSAALLLEALRQDPAWTSRFLRFRLARRARRGFSRPAPALAGPDFFDCDPSQPIVANLVEQRRGRGQFAKFEEDRLRTLAKLDERLTQGRATRSGAR